MPTKNELINGVVTLNGEVSTDNERTNGKSAAQGSTAEVDGNSGVGRSTTPGVSRGGAVATPPPVPASQESLQSYLERSLQSLREERERLVHEIEVATGALESNTLDIQIAEKALETYKDDRRTSE